MAKKQRSALSSSMAGLILSPQAKISHAFERMQGALAIPNALRWATRSDPAIMERELARQGLDMVNELASMPDTRELFSPLSPSAPDSPEQFAAQMARSNMRLYHAAVDAASLIFTHSILDTAALELCDASIALDPEAWRACVRNAQFDLRDLETMGAGPLWERALRKYLESLAHKSLMEKIDKLFHVCKPRSGTFEMGPLGRFSRERLERLDERRHSIVHGRTPPAKMPIVWETERWHKPEEDIRWLAFVGLHLVLMVASHHDCKPSLLDLAEFHLADRRGEY